MAEGGGEGQTADAHSGTHDVFISYASQDAALADTVVAALEGQGLKCWMAPRDVTPGAHYASEIVHAIDSAKAIVLILSQDAATSPHVLREIERATSKRHPVVTLRLDQAPLPAEFEYFLNTSQWLDASGGNTALAMPKLVSAVRVAIQAPAVTAIATEISPTVKTQLSMRSPNRTVIVVAFVVGLAIAAVAVNRLWLLSHPAASTPTPTMATSTPPTATAPVAFSPPAHSVAVLPFTNMSGNPKDDFFSDGLSEELLNTLASVQGLQVAARTSSFSFKGKDEAVGDIARKLNVGAILEGTVRRDKTHVRISTELINAVTGFQLWSQTYDRTLTDMLSLQSDIATSVSLALKVKLLEGNGRAADIGGTDNPKAFDAYLRARALRRQPISEKTNAETIGAYDEAISLDPRYANAYVGRAMTRISYADDSNMPTADRQLATKQAIADARKSAEIAPTLGFAHAVIGYILFNALDFAEASVEYKKGLTLSPGDARVCGYSAIYLAMIGRFDESIALARHAIDLDPLNAYNHGVLGDVYYLERRYQDAIDSYTREDQLSPPDPQGQDRGYKGISYYLLGQYEAARASCDVPAPGWLHYKCLAIVYDKLGRRADAEAQFALLQKNFGENQPYELSVVYAQWGDTPHALDALERAVVVRDSSLVFPKVDPLIDPLRNEPRFKAVLAALKFPN